MRRVVSIVALLVMLATGVALLMPALIWSRAKADLARCQENLRRLALQGLGSYAQREKMFPAGTVVSDLPADRRVSWYAEILSSIGRDDLRQKLDWKQAWNSAANERVAATYLNVAVCPAVAASPHQVHWGPANYVGCGGVGLDADVLPPDVPHAGAFRLESPTPLKAIRDGLSATLLLLETADRPGPWLSGGFATVRSIDPAAQPYIGAGHPFGGCHRNGLNTAYCDGSVHFVASSIAPAVFEQLAQIADGSQ